MHLIQNLFGLAAESGDATANEETVAGRLQIETGDLAGLSKDEFKKSLLSGTWRNFQPGSTHGRMLISTRSPIDRITHSAKDGGLHSFMELAPGNRFDVNLRIANPLSADLGFIAFWENGINDGFLRFGGLAAAGRGRMKISSTTVTLYLPINKGSILVEGQEVNATKLDKLALRKKVGMVFQQYNLFPHKTALENVKMAPIHVLKIDKEEAEKRAYTLIKKVRLEGKENNYPGELSGGQQQRVAIARSLAMNPDVMLFDEVTAALDPETVKEVLVTIKELAEDGMTCLLVTHEMGFAREVADHIYFTDEGRIVEHGPPSSFFDDAQDPRTQAFLGQIL